MNENVEISSRKWNIYENPGGESTTTEVESLPDGLNGKLEIFLNPKSNHRNKQKNQNPKQKNPWTWRWINRNYSIQRWEKKDQRKVNRTSETCEIIWSCVIWSLYSQKERWETKYLINNGWKLPRFDEKYLFTDSGSLTNHNQDKYKENYF